MSMTCFADFSESHPTTLTEFLKIPVPPAKQSTAQRSTAGARVLTSQDHIRMLEEKAKKKQEEAEKKEQRKRERLERKVIERKWSRRYK